MFQSMQWLNPPAAVSVLPDALEVTTAAKSDFWRKTHYGFTRDNGHFFFREVAGDFTVTLRWEGRYKDQYDQAGLMLRVDEENWIKTGIEFFDGVQHASAVVTREFSDWSVAPLEDAPSAFWLRTTREGEAVEIFWSRDGQQYHLLRLAYLVPGAVTLVGPMCASPDGEGFHVSFTDFQVEPAGSH